MRENVIARDGNRICPPRRHRVLGVPNDPLLPVLLDALAADTTVNRSVAAGVEDCAGDETVVQIKMKAVAGEHC